VLHVNVPFSQLWEGKANLSELPITHTNITKKLERIFFWKLFLVCFCQKGFDFFSKKLIALCSGRVIKVGQLEIPHECKKNAAKHFFFVPVTVKTG